MHNMYDVSIIITLNTFAFWIIHYIEGW